MAHGAPHYTLPYLRHAFWQGPSAEHALLKQWLDEGKSAADLFAPAPAPAPAGGVGNRYSLNPAGMGAGRWAAPSFEGARDTLGLSNGFLMFAPYHLGADLTIQNVAIEVVTGAAGSIIRLGAYAPGANGAPETLIAEYGTVDSVSAGVKVLATASAILPAGLVYLAALAQGGTPQVRFSGNSALSPVAGAPAAADVLGTTYNPSWHNGGGSTSGTLPTPLGALTRYAVMPVIAIQQAA